MSRRSHFHVCDDSKFDAFIITIVNPPKIDLYGTFFPPMPMAQLIFACHVHKFRVIIVIKSSEVCEIQNTACR